MLTRRLDIPGLIMVRPSRVADNRGFFVECYNERAAREAGIGADFVQDNLCYSKQAGTLRGLHAQAPPKAQSKLIAVTAGAIVDIAVDVRKGSPTFGRYARIKLDAEEGWQLFIPAGFLHGYVTTAPHTTVYYKVDAFYDPDSEIAVAWNDPELAIDWGSNIDNPHISARDATAPLFSEFESPYLYVEGLLW